MLHDKVLNFRGLLYLGLSFTKVGEGGFRWPSSISDPILDIHQEIIGTNIVMRDEIHSFELSRQLN